MQQLERYESIFNAVSDSIIIYDENGFIAEANPSACLIYGYDYDELINTHVSKLFLHPEDFDELKKTAFAGSQFSGTHTRIRKDGRLLEINYVGTQFIFNGKPHVLSAGKDITLQKKAEEALRKAEEVLRTREKKTRTILELKVKERTKELEKINYELLQFTSIASHDLKEPVRKISIFGKMLRDRITGSLDETSNLYLNNMINSSNRMVNLIDDLLSFSRLSQENPHFKQVDLFALIKQTIEDLEISIAEKEATLRIDTLPVIECNAVQMGEVFQNLISNSLKFSHPERKPVISITSERYTENDAVYYILSFRDNGIGFKSEYSEKIFEVFQRLHSRSKYEGTGVGLAIVKKIVSLHKGDITAFSTENDGAEFTIVLPEKQE